MDLAAYAMLDFKGVNDYIERHYGPIPRNRGVRFMVLQTCEAENEEPEVEMFKKYCGKDVVYIHTRCGDCGKGWENEHTNYVSCGGKEWEEKHKDLFLEHCCDYCDQTYADHYFKAVVDDEYREIVNRLRPIYE